MTQVFRASSGCLLPERKDSSHIPNICSRGGRLRQAHGQAAGNRGRIASPPQAITEADCSFLLDAAALADSSAGLVQPHPNAGCVLVSPDGRALTRTFLRAQGAASAEEQAVSLARAAASGATAYLNLETGDCHGDDAAVRSLVQAGVARAVIGLRHPLRHSRGLGIRALQSAGIEVDVVGEAPCLASSESQSAALSACLSVNEALLHRAATGRPLSVLKYAMTLDGKIATSAGHASWVSCAESRAKVFAVRARSDAVIVGGNTVRRDNPNLTTRCEGGHKPVRIVMSRTLDLPADLNLWDVATAPTIVMTQRGARQAFQEVLRSRGVEVVQFDFLTPDAVAAYCFDRGFLQCLWECGGTLAAPAIASRVIHKAMAFIAPKLIGGVRAPSPVGELGNVEMTQALTLTDLRWEAVGSDMSLQGYLPSSGGLRALQARLAKGDSRSPLVNEAAESSEAYSDSWGQTNGSVNRRRTTDAPKPVEFYKAWDEWGALSNFSPHPIRLPEGPAAAGTSMSHHGPSSRHRLWKSVEHYYQAQKFAGVNEPDAFATIDDVAAAESPEEAARIGRAMQRSRPHLVRPDWDTAKLFVMLAALQAKFEMHAGPQAMLLSTSDAQGDRPLVEGSPNDFFWGRGVDGSGSNHLGALLGRIRATLQQKQPQDEVSALPEVSRNGSRQA